MSELSAQGPIAHHGATSVVDTSAYQKLGTRGVDTDGNIYVYVDFQQALTLGEWVVIDSAFAASRLTSTSRGWVGVVVSTVSASDRFGWVQIYGKNSAAIATSGSSSGFPVILAATTDLGSVDTLGTSVDASVLLNGVIITAGPDTCASTALSSSALMGYASVILNFPFVTGSVAVSAS